MNYKRKTKVKLLPPMPAQLEEDGLTSRSRSNMFEFVSTFMNGAMHATFGYLKSLMRVSPVFWLTGLWLKMSLASDEKKRATSRQARPLGPALRIALISISAALYAAAIGATSPVSTPWGVGQFRPGVVFPAVFAVIYGPLIGGAGAAVGTFVGDVVFLTPLGLTTPLLSLIAGVPGNFVGFFLLGWFVRRYSSWFGFVFGSLVSLLVGNFIAALGVVAYLAVDGWSTFQVDALVGAVFGFTFFWLVTMIPFVIPLVPPLVVALQPLVGSQMNVGVAGWRRGSGSEALRSSLVVSAVLGVLYALVQFTSLGDVLFKSVTGPQFIPWLKLLFLVSALVVFIFGTVVGLVLRRERKK